MSRHMKVSRRIILVILMTLISGTLAFTAPAQAGSNGQQIFITAAASNLTATSLTISGYNQHDQFTIYYQSLGFPGTIQYVLNNWWWKNEVLVTIGVVQYPVYATTVTCWVYVPPSQSSNWVRVNFTATGCW